MANRPSSCLVTARLRRSAALLRSSLEPPRRCGASSETRWRANQGISQLTSDADAILRAAYATGGLEDLCAPLFECVKLLSTRSAANIRLFKLPSSPLPRAPDYAAVAAARYREPAGSRVGRRHSAGVRRVIPELVLDNDVRQVQGRHPHARGSTRVLRHGSRLGFDLFFGLLFSGLLLRLGCQLCLARSWLDSPRFGLRPRDECVRTTRNEAPHRWHVSKGSLVWGNPKKRVALYSAPPRATL